MQRHARSKVSPGRWRPGGELPAAGRRLRAPLSLLQGTNCLGVMHTGQDCGLKDYRKIRIVSHQKEVSENFATDLIAEPT